MEVYEGVGWKAYGSAISRGVSGRYGYGLVWVIGGEKACGLRMAPRIPAAFFVNV